MIEFERPNIECIKIDDENNYSKFVCEPLERGYGVTIGNSLRRILLSSLPGCSLTSVKINGVLHEFSSIPNVVEDVPEIIVNLKNVRLKFDGEEEKILRVDFKGEGEVTAADIQDPYQQLLPSVPHSMQGRGIGSGPAAQKEKAQRRLALCSWQG